jgi:hypothetical protein
VHDGLVRAVDNMQLKRSAGLQPLEGCQPLPVGSRRGHRLCQSARIAGGRNQCERHLRVGIGSSPYGCAAVALKHHVVAEEICKL